jgi:ACR3 family arsenite efflux pump ArsB
MNTNLNRRLMMLKILFLLIIIPLISGEISRYYNSECGESPTQKYKELAKIIGEYKC